MPTAVALMREALQSREVTGLNRSSIDMSDAPFSSTERPPRRLVSFLFAGLQALFLLGGAAITASRDGCLELSHMLFGSDVPLMGSRLLDLIVHNGTAFVLVAMAIAALAKLYVGPRWRWPAELALLLAILACDIWLIAGLYAPAFS